MKLEPLKQWYCDTCGDVIEKPEDGWLEWVQEKTEAGRLNCGFRIVHQFMASPRANPAGRDPEAGSCYYSRKQLPMDSHLHHALDFGIAYVLNLLDVGEYHDPDKREAGRVVSVREWSELVRRLYVPYYEQARRYFRQVKRDGDYDGVNDVGLYSASMLKGIVEKYSGEDFDD